MKKVILSVLIAICSVSSAYANYCTCVNLGDCTDQYADVALELYNDSGQYLGTIQEFNYDGSWPWNNRCNQAQRKCSAKLSDTAECN